VPVVPGLNGPALPLACFLRLTWSGVERIQVESALSGCIVTVSELYGSQYYGWQNQATFTFDAFL
jgi:hypothetical protein